MKKVLTQPIFQATLLRQKLRVFSKRRGNSPDFSLSIRCILLGCLVLLTTGSFTFLHPWSEALAGQDCTRYHVVAGDTLSYIAKRYSTTVHKLGQLNAIANLDLIFVGQQLCLPPDSSGDSKGASGVGANGTVRWYAYDALQRASQQQVVSQLRAAARQYNLPTNLLLAIAWQESNWRQNVISHDGGIGVMQIMPATAQGLNVETRAYHDPYKLHDNIELGAIYLHTLWKSFGGNLTQIISAYNEGGWSVVHRGIFNWSYVNSVRSLMTRFS